MRGFAGIVGVGIALALSGCAGTTGLFGGGSSIGYRQLMEAQRARDAAAQEDEQRPPATVADRLLEGDRHAESGDRKRALWNYLEAYRLAPDRPEPLNRLGFYYLPEDPERAAAIFSRVLVEAPDSATAHTGLGLARLSQRRLDEAQRSLEQAVALEPGFPTALDALGVVYVLRDRKEEGRNHAQNAYRLDPRDAQIVNNLGVAHLASGEWAKAEQAFRSAILLDPSDPAFYNNLGLALGRQAHYDEALAAFRHFGDEQATHNNLGYIYFLNGEREKAIQHYELALQAEGDDRLAVMRNLKAAASPTAAQR
jgi:Flp pilus assembly protein TadD